MVALVARRAMPSTAAGPVPVPTPSTGTMSIDGLVAVVRDAPAGVRNDRLKWPPTSSASRRRRARTRRRRRDVVELFQPASSWPILSSTARHGIVGEVVTAVEPHTEAGRPASRSLVTWTATAEPAMIGLARAPPGASRLTSFSSRRSRSRDVPGLLACRGLAGGAPDGSRQKPLPHLGRDASLGSAFRVHIQPAEHVTPVDA